MHFLGAIAQPSGAVQHIATQLVPSFTEVLSSLHAIRASPAGGNERKYHMVAGLGVGNTRSDFLDYSGAFVTQNYRHGVFSVAFHIVQITVANAAGGDFDQYFMLFWAFQLQVLNDQWLELFV